MRKGPWEPVAFVAADIAAMQALEKGTATPEQQKRALAWIIEKAAGVYEQSFWPGAEGARNTDFAEGRRFVGNSVIKLTRLNVTHFLKKEAKNVD
jgi:hypothetical protein